MAQLWAYAHRRYARFQGYAWGGVVIVGAVAWGASRVMGAGEGRKKREDARVSATTNLYDTQTS